MQNDPAYNCWPPSPSSIIVKMCVPLCMSARWHPTFHMMNWEKQILSYILVNAECGYVWLITSSQNLKSSTYLQQFTKCTHGAIQQLFGLTMMCNSSRINNVKFTTVGNFISVSSGHLKKKFKETVFPAMIMIMIIHLLTVSCLNFCLHTKWLSLHALPTPKIQNCVPPHPQFKFALKARPFSDITIKQNHKVHLATFKHSTSQNASVAQLHKSPGDDFEGDNN